MAAACTGFSRSVVSVDWATAYQTIDGFGAASNETSFVEPLSDEMMDFFFTTKGIGLSLLRIRGYASLHDCESDSGAGACVPRDGATVLKTDLQIARMAIARGVRVWSSQWSPPGSMKENRDFTKGGAMIGTSENYRALAGTLVDFVGFMRGQGVALVAVSPQNEPDMSMWYPSATWTPEQIHAFVPYLHDALRAAGAADTKIMIAEESRWTSRWLWWNALPFAAAVMRDPDVAARVGIVAAHNYDQRNPSSPPKVPNLTTQRIWQTEASTFETFDGGMVNALVWAQRIHAFLSHARVNAFHYWYLTAGPRDRDNQSLVDGNGRVARRAHVFGNWSRFVRPGWHQVAVRSSGGLLVTAFRNDGGDQSAIVVVNAGAKPVAQRYVIGGAVRTVTPWVTSSERALEPQPPVSVAESAFVYTVPAQAVVTFAGSLK
jgi:glucuronoarabinoxylan endo-1,4-beta-xylanase